jgi:predicted DNA-binding transcriptional regulator AlpA
VKLGPRISAWRVEDVRALIENPERALIELKAAVR